MVKWIVAALSLSLLAACADTGSSNTKYKRTQSHSKKIMRSGGY